MSASTEQSAPRRPQARRPTRERILDAALEAYGSRGFEATSLDDLAATVGVSKQTVLYWFTSKDELLAAVVARSAHELRVVLEAAARAPGTGLDRVDAVVRAVFRPAVRRPALLGLLREVTRLGSPMVDLVLVELDPLVRRAVAFLEEEMAAGRMRHGDPWLVLVLCYTTVAGVATEPQALRAVGWEPTPTGLRHLRSELLAYLRAALGPVA